MDDKTGILAKLKVGIAELELSKLKIMERNGKLKGRLILEDRERVMQFLKETDVFDNITKKRYGIIA